MKRDRALVALLYLLALRISEALRLRRSNFILPDEDGGYEDRIVVRGIKLSKSRWRDKPRKEQYRQINWLPLKGERAKLTGLVLDYLKELDYDEKLFKFDRRRAWEIVVHLTGLPCHFFRAFGEEYLYERWGRDILAVADYVKVDPVTLQQYIRRRYERYEVV